MACKIFPSLAAAPMDRLGQAVASLEAAGVDALHFDIEDGSFVPVMTLGTKIISDLRSTTKLPFDVHLMMVNPEWLIPALAETGVQRLSVHFEACPYPRRLLRQIHERGIQAGLAFNPATAVPDLAYLKPYLSFVLILTSEPEMPDSPFLPEVLDKIRKEKQGKALEGIEWVADGGIDAGNLSQVTEAGADVAVIGRAVFKDGKPLENLQVLRQAAE